MVQDVGYPFRTVPLQAVQVVPDGVVAVLVGNDADGGFDLLLAGNTVFLHSPQDILHIGIVQGLAGARPAHRLYDVDKELDKLCQVPQREVCAIVLRWR